MRKEAGWEMLVRGGGTGRTEFSLPEMALSRAKPRMEVGGTELPSIPGRENLGGCSEGPTSAATLNGICMEITHVSRCKMSLRPLCLPPRASRG